MPHEAGVVSRCVVAVQTAECSVLKKPAVRQLEDSGVAEELPFDPDVVLFCSALCSAHVFC